MDGRFDETVNYIVEIHGYNSLSKEVQEHCAMMLDVFNEVQKKTPTVKFCLIS